MRTGNPALRASTFTALPSERSRADRMTIAGTVHRCGFFLLLVMLGAGWAWTHASMTSVLTAEGLSMPNPGLTRLYMIVGGVGGLVFAIATYFRQRSAAFTGSLYCLFEGLMIGGMSAFAEALYPGIALQASILTFGTLATLLTAYRSGLIKATENFRLGVAAATGGVMMLYLVSFVGSMFGFGIPYIHESGMVGIGFSAFVVVLAALNLVLDFDFIEKGARHGAPKHMEWYAAFGLIVTLVWLYIEILRLLMKLQSRD
jgi:uncharacterized YccA/Bax inhibitor family protein